MFCSWKLWSQSHISWDRPHPYISLQSADVVFAEPMTNDGSLTNLESEVPENLEYGNLSFNPGKLDANALPRAHSKLKIAASLDLCPILPWEPFWVILFRVGEVVGVHVNTYNGDHNSGAFWNCDVCPRYGPVFCAASCCVWKWRKSSRFIETALQVFQLIDPVPREDSSTSLINLINFSLGFVLDIRIDSNKVQCIGNSILHSVIASVIAMVQSSRNKCRTCKGFIILLVQCLRK